MLGGFAVSIPTDSIVTNAEAQGSQATLQARVKALEAAVAALQAALAAETAARKAADAALQAGIVPGLGNCADVGTVSLAINPLSHVASLSCPPSGQFQLTVAVSGPGTIASPPSDIDCGSGLGDCSHSFQNGAIVTLTEMHDESQASFFGWGGACSGTAATCQVTMDQARLVTATFLP